MFSQLDKLNVNDIIFVSDLNENKMKYIIYDKYTTNENNLTCTNSTKDIEVTLITCNRNNNKKRIVIKAKMKEQ